MKSLLSPIEPLEARIAPAMVTLTVVDAHTATYTDTDGDLVTVKVSKGTLDPGGANFVGIGSGSGDQLQQLDLTDPIFAGASITITAVPVEPGDGFVNVGYINATGRDLGAVNIHGDLAAIDAGDAATKSGLKSLTVQSFGTLGTTSGAPNLNSDIVGALGKLNVKGSMIGAALAVTGGTDAKVKSVSIGVTLQGGSGDRSGAIYSTGDMGKVTIGFDLQGGNGHESGALLSDGKIASVTIGHNLNGGGVATGIGAGMIHSKGDLGKVIIKSDLLGGLGDSSGSILSDKLLKEVYIGGNVQGGIVIIGMTGTLRTGHIHSGGDMGKVTIMGTLLGTFLPLAASIDSDGKIASVYIGGAIIGGEDDAGSINATGSIGTIKIVGDVRGGYGDGSGLIHSGGDIKTVAIGGNLAGGTANRTGLVEAVNFGTIAITGSMFGGNSQNLYSFTDSGAILATSIQTLTIGDNLTGGSTNNQTLARVGFVSATTIKTLFIGGSLRGGGSSGSGSVTDSGSIYADHIDSIVIGGSLEAGFQNSGHTVTRAGSITVVHDIGALTIRGSVIGRADSGNGVLPVVISAVGQAAASATKDLAIGSLTIGGNVSLTNILAGYDPDLDPVNGNAQIGAVRVVGNWTASNLVAGVMNTDSNNLFFGTGDDAIIGTGTIASIASISIGGTIAGTAGGTDHYGFVAHQIGNFILGGQSIGFTPGPFRDFGTTGDVSLHLV